MLKKLKTDRKKLIAKKVFIFAMIVSSIICLYVFSNNKIKDNIQNNKIMKYGNPIDQETGIINNDFFDIYNDGSNAEKTTKGINKAIVYAYKNNIQNIKLEQGEYLIKIDSKNKAINMFSNINLDLNKSYLKIETNSYSSYRMFFLKNISNVKIFNGILVGDSDTHDYKTIESEHQWGFGINIRGSSNVEIYDIEFYNFTGDGIYIDKYNKSFSSNNIKICNNNIHNCRRQGITIVDGNDIEICYNEFHDISGSNPQAGIDLEANNENEIIENIKIYNNKFYNFGRNFAIQLYEGVESVDIYENEVYGILRVNDAKKEVNVYNNILKNGKINIYLSEINIEKGNALNIINITNNIMNNYSIETEKVNLIKITNNDIEDGTINIKSSNAKINNNNIKINKNVDYVYCYSVDDTLKRNFEIQTDSKKVKGNYNILEKIQESDFLIINRKSEQ